MNNAHIIYHFMGTSQPVDLAQSYFAHSHYLLVQLWINAAILVPDSVYPGGPQVFHFVTFFPGGHTHEYTSFHCNVANVHAVHPILSLLIHPPKLLIIVTLAIMCQV